MHRRRPEGFEPSGEGEHSFLVRLRRGGQVHTRARIEGTGVPIIILSFGARQSEWRTALEGRTGKARLIWLDVPGFGGSRVDSERHFDFTYIVRWLKASAEHLGYDQVCVAGEGFAGLVALWAGLSYPSTFTQVYAVQPLLRPSWGTRLVYAAASLPGARERWKKRPAAAMRLLAKHTGVVDPDQADQVQGDALHTLVRSCMSPSRIARLTDTLTEQRAFWGRYPARCLAVFNPSYPFGRPDDASYLKDSTRSLRVVRWEDLGTEHPLNAADRVGYSMSRFFGVAKHADTLSDMHYPDTASSVDDLGRRPSTV